MRASRRQLPGLALAFALASAGAARGQTPEMPTVAQPPAVRPAGHTLEDRVAALTRALDLSAQQQQRLRGILEAQRRAILRIWQDKSLIEGERPPAMRAVIDRSADEIRAMLTDAQRQKYNPPRPQDTPRASSADLAKWLDAMQRTSAAAAPQSSTARTQGTP